MLSCEIFRNFLTPNEFRWSFTRLNSGRIIDFEGATNADQYANVQAFSQAMRTGPTEVRFNASRIFDAQDFAPKEEPQAIIGDWLDSASELILNGLSIYVAPAAGTLEVSAYLEEAGRLLEACLP